MKAYLCVFLFLSVLNGITWALTCVPCPTAGTTCPALDCDDLGIQTLPCACCESCAQDCGQICGGAWGIYGQCGSDMICVNPDGSLNVQFLTPSPNGICQYADMNRACGKSSSTQDPVTDGEVPVTVTPNPGETHPKAPKVNIQININVNGNNGGN